MRSQPNFLGRAGLGLLFLLAAINGRAKETTAGMPPNVAVVRTAVWSQGDAAREGAAELMVLLEIARLRRESPQGGVIAVGDRRGLFSAGAEETLRHAALQGLPVVKLAPSGQVLPAPHGLFLDGGNLSEQEAGQVLARCLERYGPPPPTGGSSSGEAIRSELRARLQLYQLEFTLAASPRVAVR